MKSDYQKLKIKMCLQVLVAAIITGIVGVFIKNVLIDGVLQEPFADSFVAFCERALLMDNTRAIYTYQSIFLYNKEMILMAGFVILLLIFLFITMSRFVHYFNQISDGVDKLLDNSEQPIILKPELSAMQTKLNTVKTTLKEQKNAALESEQRKNDLVVYLAHDLKTPLTSVIGYLSLLQEAPDMPIEQKAKYTSIALKKALRLEELINEFFDITRFNLQNILLEEQDIKLAMMLEQMADEFFPLLSTKEMTANVQVAEDILISGDADKLARVFGNLIKNAISYGAENTTIEISAVKAEADVRLSFKNKGSKISERELEHIFEKFYRLDSARSSNSGGSGLGLAIAKKIIELHHGSISAESTSEFTEFVVTLPLKS